MWPTTSYPEKTYRFFKNVYGNYGRNKSTPINQDTILPSVPGAHPRPHLERHKSIHDESPIVVSPPSTLSPSTSSTTSPVLANLTNTTVHAQPKQSVNRLFHSLANDVKHRFSMSRLVKSAPNSQTVPQKRSSPELDSPLDSYPPHEPLYYRASSPLFDRHHYDVKQMHELYASTARLHHSEPLKLSPEHSPIHSRNFLSPALGPRQHSPLQSRSYLYRNHSQRFATSLSRHETEHEAHRRLSYRSLENNSPNCLDKEHVDFRQSGVRSIVLDRFASELDTENYETGGITLCGGSEVGLQSIYISRVAENSAAEKCDLHSGDQILSANYVSFLDSITCKRAYKILSDQKSQFVLLTILPRHETFGPRPRRHHCYAWIDPNGHNVSPPPPDREQPDLEDGDLEQTQTVENEFRRSFRRAPHLRDLNRRGSSAHQIFSKLNSLSLFKRKSSTLDDVRQVTITLEKGIDLGLMIRGGIEYGLGIYVTRVDPNSLADKAQLQVGDQIISVNNYDFGEVLHDEAVEILKSSSRLTMKVRFIGKVPASSYAKMESSTSEWSSRHSPRYPASSSSSASGEIKDYLMNSSPSTMQTSPSKRNCSSPHQRLSPLSHSNSPSISSLSRRTHSLHQPHSYHNDRISPRLIRSKEILSTFDERETPTLLITDSDNHNLAQDDSESNEDDHQLFMLTSDRRTLKKANSTKHFRFRKRLQTTKSEEEEQIFDEECMKYLNENERITLAYYRNEYETKSMTIDAFVALILELLDTNQKYSIIQHLHHVIRPEDIDRFDELVYKREEQAILKSKALPEAIKFKNFFDKQDSSESSSFEELNESKNSYGALSLPNSKLSIHQNCSMRSESAGGAPRHSYSARLDLMKGNSPTSGSNHHAHHNVHYGQSSNRLSRSECLMPRLSGNVPMAPLPNSAAYRKTFMTRRHSSGTSDTPIVRETSPHLHNDHHKPNSTFGSYPTVADERRWSIAAAECRRSSTLLAPHDLRRSPSPAKMAFSRAEQRSREDIEALQQHILSRKGSNSSCCQETIVESSEPVSVMPPSSSSVPLGAATGTLRGSGNHLHVPNVNGNSDSEDSDQLLLPGHMRVRRHRSLPSPTFSSDKLPTSNFPHQQRSSSFRLPSHKAISEPNGRWRVKVKKSKAFLGIAIEGGVNVSTQSQPRIISIHNAGAAVECGDLHVGHIILEVDGQSTASLNHEQVAQMISRAYYNTPHKDYIEFLVREKSRNEFDLRRSSFMLLNNSFE